MYHFSMTTFDLGVVMNCGCGFRMGLCLDFLYSIGFAGNCGIQRSCFRLNLIMPQKVS